LGTVGFEEFDDFGIPISVSQDARSVAIIVGCIDVSAMLDEDLRDIGKTLFASYD
jgi:hypothetical protein